MSAYGSVSARGSFEKSVGSRGQLAAHLEDVRPVVEADADDRAGRQHGAQQVGVADRDRVARAGPPAPPRGRRRRPGAARRRRRTAPGSRPRLSPRMTAARGPSEVRTVARRIYRPTNSLCGIVIAEVCHGRDGCRLTRRTATVTLPHLPESTPKTLFITGGEPRYRARDRAARRARRRQRRDAREDRPSPSASCRARSTPRPRRSRRPAATRCRSRRRARRAPVEDAVARTAERSAASTSSSTTPARSA